MSDKIIGVRFKKGGKIYHFDATGFDNLKPGDYVLAETSRGSQIGEVVSFVKDNKASGNNVVPIKRIATARDMVIRQLWRQKEQDAVLLCRETAKSLGIEGIKFVDAEFSFDGKSLTIFYSTEGLDKKSNKKLQDKVKRSYPRKKVEFKQIGPRDAAKIMGGLGACGLETRCCTMFLTEFSPISIRMAKAQGISLSPSEITGMCGRLRCCLIYEYQMYAEVRGQLPKKGKIVVTPFGEGKVIDVAPLKETVVVQIDDLGQKEVPLGDIIPKEEYEKLKNKAENGCDNCNGGKS